MAIVKAIALVSARLQQFLWNLTKFMKQTKQEEIQATTELYGGAVVPVCQTYDRVTAKHYGQTAVLYKNLSYGLVFFRTP